MSQSSSHPRRSPRSSLPPPSLSVNALRKSDTFSARTGLRSSLYNHRDNISLRPKRSPTTLDESLVVDRARLTATRQAIVDKYLDNIDAALHSDSPEASLRILNDNSTLAVPNVIANQVIVPEQMDIDGKKHINEHHHCSDSGLGSSVDTPQQGSTPEMAVGSMHKSTNQSKDTRTLASTISSTTSVHSAITKSFSASGSEQQAGSELSTDGLKHISENILEPLLANLSLKEFHPLIAAVPAQVQSKIISNLRDLEKTFLYGAPRFSSSPKSFVKFWEFSIQCLHSTVDFLTERDQKRPSDRPYTNNYFLDLVEQINRYAAIMRQTRERQERGEPLDEMDYSPDEQITIEGGLTTNGRPAELVRKKNGKSISLLPDEARADADAMTFKRPFKFDDDSSDDDDDDVLRSMARRRKSDKAGDVMHVCADCKKEFKRPCDLTKHEKTHSRPFKCSEPSCRYHDLGWPTEKERDRHVNDKHSSAPKMYTCHFSPCSYSSKRESNCKQHMEKAHGWTYVRSKSNGRKREGTETGSVSLTPPTPLTPLQITPGYTPDTNFAPSPWWSADHGMQMGESSRSAMQLYGNPNRRDSVTTANTNQTYDSGLSPDMFCQTIGQDENIFKSPANFTMNLDFQNSAFPLQSAMDFVPTQTSFQQNFDLSVPAQMASNVNLNELPPVSIPNGQSTASAQAAHFSPTGQADVVLYSPDQDEGYSAEGPLDDFVLFPSDGGAAASNQFNGWAVDANTNNNFGSQFDSLYDPTSMFPN